MIKITLEDDSHQLEEVVVVGYGQQKKASVVGAITQTTGKVLERAAGVSVKNSFFTSLTGESCFNVSWVSPSFSRRQRSLNVKCEMCIRDRIWALRFKTPVITLRQEIM